MSPIAFVTGGTGFVGSHLCQRLRRDGWAVRALTRSGSDRAILSACGCEFVEGDLFSRDAVADGAKGADAIFNLAGVTMHPDPAVLFRVNRDGTREFARALKVAGITAPLVHLSSLAAGGPNVSVEYRTEEDPDRPAGYYGRSKLAGERVLRRARLRGPVVLLRPGTIYGPREKEILKLFQTIKRLGITPSPMAELRIQVTHAEDVVDAMIAAIPAATGEVPKYYINHDAVHDYDDVLRMLGRIQGRRVRILPLPLWAGDLIGTIGDAAGKLAGKSISPLGRDKMREIRAGRWYASSAAFRAATGWAPRYDLREGLADMLRWAEREGRL